MHYPKLKIALILPATSQNSFAVEGMIVEDPAGLMQNIYADISRSLEAAREFVVENSREQARDSLGTLQFLTHGTLIDGKREPGRVEQYAKYSESRLGSERWLCQVTNSCSDSYIPPAELLRRTAEIQAVMSSLQLDQYKSDLRKEALLQSALLNKNK